MFDQLLGNLTCGAVVCASVFFLGTIELLLYLLSQTGGAATLRIEDMLENGLVRACSLSRPFRSVGVGLSDDLFGGIVA